MTKRPRQVAQEEVRSSIDVGPGLKHVSTVRHWYDEGYFNIAEQAVGAFMLAYQQGLDGMGRTIPEWTGLSDDEYDAWMRDVSLPPRKTAR